jgi:hypothetical protein
MKISDLRIILSAIPAEHDGAEVVVWLPGSKIDLAQAFMTYDKETNTIMVEGDLREGSALIRRDDWS